MNYRFKVKITIITIYCILVFVYCNCNTFFYNNNDLDIPVEVLQYRQTYRETHKSSYLGIATSFDKSSEKKALLSAEQRAYADLSSQIKSDIFSVVEDFYKIINDNDKKKDFTLFQQWILKTSSVWMPYNVKPKCHFKWENRRGYNVLIIVEIGQVEYKNQIKKNIYAKYPTMSEVLREFNTYLDYYFRVKTNLFKLR